MFHKESISGFHDFKQKSGHRTNSWSEWDKNLTKNCWNLLYSYTKTQSNTHATPLVSLDNSTTLTISDLFVVHSCSHPTDPKNGLKLFFLLSLCSFSAAFVVSEDDMPFNFDWYLAQVLILRCKKDVSRMWDLLKDFIESSKSGTSSLYLIFPNWKLKIKLPFDHHKISWAWLNVFPLKNIPKCNEK